MKNNKSNKEYVVNQHYIPASHIGRFSIDGKRPLRERRVWVMRVGNNLPFITKAEKVGFMKEMYTLSYPGLNGIDHIDKSWGSIEQVLTPAINQLENHKSEVFDLVTWSTILVPFIAQLFVRGIDYSNIFLERTPIVKVINETEKEVKDNINNARLIDYQIFCSLLITTEWKLYHNNTEIPFILNDRGYCIFHDIPSDTYGFAIPLSPKILIMIADNEENYLDLYGNENTNEPSLVLLPSLEFPSNEIKMLNNQIAFYSNKEIYGQTEDLTKEAWDNRIVKNSINKLIDPYAVFKKKNHIDYLYQYYDFLKKINVKPDTIRSAMGGNFILKMGRDA